MESRKRRGERATHIVNLVTMIGKAWVGAWEHLSGGGVVTG